MVGRHYMLAPAADEAVKQWEYKPYLLNGEPVDVETRVTMNFIAGDHTVTMWATCRRAFHGEEGQDRLQRSG